MATIPGYTAITSVEGDDLFVVVDVNDTTMSAAGTTKKMTFSQLQALFAEAPAGTASAGFVPVATGTGEASEWFPGPGLPPSGDTTGATDVTNIQNLLNLGLNAPLQSGTFYTDAPLVVPPGVTLQGAAGNTFSLTDYGTVIKPAAGWAQGDAAGSGIILLLSQYAGGYSAASAEQKLLDFMIDGSVLTDLEDANTGINGVLVVGNVGSVTVSRVNISQVPGIGFYGIEDGESNSPAGVWMVDHLTVHRAGLNGINFGATDSNWTDCYVIGSGQWADSDGWVIGTSSNSIWHGCRSEDSIGGNGFTYTCSNSSANGVTFSACSTQGNAYYGFMAQQHINSGAGPLKLVGCNFNNDGVNFGVAGSGSPPGAGTGTGGGGYASIYITNYKSTVTIVGCESVPGVQFSDVYTPEYGLKIASNSGGYVLVSGSHLGGYTAAVSDDDSSAAVIYDPTTVLAVGEGGSITYSTPYTVPGILTTELTAIVASVAEGISEGVTLGDLLGWSLPIAYCSGSLQGTSGYYYLAQVLVPAGGTTTYFNMVTHASGGAGATISYAGACIINSSGAVLATTGNIQGTTPVPTGGDQLWQPAWTSPYDIAAGTYWGLVFIVSSGAMPTWISGNVVTNAINNLGCTAAAVNLRSAYLNTVEAALPGSLTMSGLSNYEGPLFMAFS